MADQTSDLYPIPVEFVDGQQPTAAFLNAWALQIDSAFVLLGRMIGDFDGTGEVQTDTYVTNILRAMGTQGVINTRLPRGVKVAGGAGPGSDLPRVIDAVGLRDEGKLESELRFFPAATEATDPANINGIELITSDLLFDAVDKGVPVKTSTLDSADKWLLDGRRILTSTPILQNATVTYAIDTSAANYFDAYGPDTGANIIPSMHEIASVSEKCTIVSNGGQDYTLSFPDIRRIQNPQKPWISPPFPADPPDPDNSIDMVAGPEVKWEGANPKWRVPKWLYDLASNQGGSFPAGTVALWHATPGGIITRVEDPTNTEQLTFARVLNNLESIKITLPAGMAIPAIDDQYILAFAGTSMAEALLHERSRMLHHKHDGQGDESIISVEFLKDKFNPAEFFHSVIGYNHSPQYLGRRGYQTGTDGLNRNNALLGDLLLANTNASQSDPLVAPDDATVSSYKVMFSDSSSAGAHLWFNPADVEGSGDLGTPTTGKLTLSNRSLRATSDNFYLGPIGSSVMLKWRGGLAQTLDIIDLDAGVQDIGYTRVRTGGLILVEDGVWFGDPADISDPISQSGTHLRKASYDGSQPGLTGGLTLRVDDALSSYIKCGRIWEQFVNPVLKHISPAAMSDSYHHISYAAGPVWSLRFRLPVAIPPIPPEHVNLFIPIAIDTKQNYTYTILDVDIYWATDDNTVNVPATITLTEFDPTDGSLTDWALTVPAPTTFDGFLSSNLNIETYTMTPSAATPSINPDKPLHVRINIPHTNGATENLYVYGARVRYNIS